MLRVDLIPPDQIEIERARLRRRFADRFFAQKLGVAAMLCVSVLCGAGLVAHLVAHPVERHTQSSAQMAALEDSERP